MCGLVRIHTAYRAKYADGGNVYDMDEHQSDGSAKQAVKPPIPDPAIEPTISVSRAAKILGVGTRTAYDLVHRNEWPWLKVGGITASPQPRSLPSTGHSSTTALLLEPPRFPCRPEPTRHPAEIRRWGVKPGGCTDRHEPGPGGKPASTSPERGQQTGSFTCPLLPFLFSSALIFPITEYPHS